MQGKVLASRLKSMQCSLERPRLEGLSCRYLAFKEKNSSSVDVSAKMTVLGPNGDSHLKLLTFGWEWTPEPGAGHLKASTDLWDSLAGKGELGQTWSSHEPGERERMGTRTGLSILRQCPSLFLVIVLVLKATFSGVNMVNPTILSLSQSSQGIHFSTLLLLACL